MNRKQRSDGELREASKHLHYELDMLRGTARLLARGVHSDDSVLPNAVLESFTLHARALLDFLYDQSPRSDDVVASDYFTDPQDWISKRPAMSSTLTQVDHRVGKEIAHLTYVRSEVTDEMKNWPFIEIANDVKRVLAVFVDAVPKSRVASLWHSS